MTVLRAEPGDSAALLHGQARLPQFGVIAAHGDEAADFLHRQLTQDILALARGASCLAALCNAKGRVLADLVVFRKSDREYVLAVNLDLLALTLRLLAMYRLRSRVELRDASAEYSVFGSIGAAPTPRTEDSAVSAGRALSAALPAADGARRSLDLTDAGSALEAGPALTVEHWNFAQVRSGVATLSAAVSGAFTPQMLNYESTGVIAFGKGCYPGQEVIARTQFRGAVKRRAYVGHVDGAARAGEDVFEAGHGTDPCGSIIQAAAAPGGGCAVIVSMKTAVAERPAALTVGSAQGPALSGLVIPYPLKDI